MLFLLAVFPIFLALVLMTKFRVKPGAALPAALLCTGLTAFFAWGMPIKVIAAVSLLGVLKSLDIILIVYCAVLLLNILKENKAFDVINSTFSSLSPDRRIQLVIIAWFFSSFIEGAAGFGSAPALAAPLLAGLGFPVIAACSAALAGNTYPVPFGAVGTPTITLNAILSENVTRVGMAPLAFSHQLMQSFSDISLLSGVFMPFVMVAFTIFLTDGKNKIRSIIEIFPFCMFSGIVYFVPWKITAMYLGPELPSMVGPVCAFPVILAVLKYKPAFLVPEHVWDFEEKPLVNTPVRYSTGEQFKAWLPYLLIAVLLIVTRLPMLPFKGYLTSVTLSLPEIFGVNGTAFLWKILYNPGVFPFLFVSAAAWFIFGIRKQHVAASFAASAKQIFQAALAIGASFAIVQIMVFSNNSSSGVPGMLTIIASTASACLGKAYFAAAPVIGVMGTFFAGSCTVSNILFGSIQFDTAHIARLPEEIIVALQNAGGGIGSMIRISGVVATCATVNASGKEGKLVLLNCIPCAVMIVLTLAAALFILF